MKIFWNECKKYRSFPLLLFVLSAHFITYMLLTDYDIRMMKQGKSTASSITVHRELVDTYGPSMTKEDWEDVKRITALYTTRLDAYVQNDVELQQLGVNTFEEWQQLIWEENERGERASALHDDWIFESNESEDFWLWQEYDRLLSFYEGNETYIEQNRHGPGHRDAAYPDYYEQLYEQSTIAAQPERIFLIVRNLTTSAVLIVVLVTLLITAPVHYQDRMQRMIPLQYSTTYGRRLPFVKWLASMTLSGILTFIMIVVYAYLMERNGHLYFVDVPIRELISGEIWFDWTIGEWLWMTVVVLFFFTFVSTIVGMWIGTYAKNALQLAGGVILAVIGCAAILLPLSITRLFRAWYPPFYTWVQLGSIGLFAIILLGAIVYCEKKKDVVPFE